MCRQNGRKKLTKGEKTTYKQFKQVLTVSLAWGKAQFKRWKEVRGFGQYLKYLKRLLPGKQAVASLPGHNRQGFQDGRRPWISPPTKKEKLHREIRSTFPEDLMKCWPSAWQTNRQPQSHRLPSSSIISIRVVSCVVWKQQNTV